MTQDGIRLVTHSPDETQRMAARIAALLRPNDVLALCGMLGAGKTCFVKGLARGLGVRDERAVSSPSFVLLKQHEGKLTLYHFDAYRLSSAEDMEAIGCAELFRSGGVSVIEWADRVAGSLPEERIWIQITVKGQNTREFTIQARGPDCAERMDALASALVCGIP